MMASRLSSLLEAMDSVLTYLRTIRWKNPRAEPNQAYVPTPVEHVANVLTHALLIGPSIWALLELVSRCNSSVQLTAAVLYGSSLVLLFSVSAIFHSVCFCCQRGLLKDALHRCDRAVIYIFIAASYSPWAVLINFPSGSLSEHVYWIIWVLAFAGICYQQLFHERYKTIETLCYLCMGLLPAVIINPHTSSFSGYQDMTLGGVLYIVGVLFFKADGFLPFAHAIWHCFVAAAAAQHYLTIARHLFPEQQHDADVCFLRRLLTLS